MNSIDSKIPHSDQWRIAELEAEVERLRADSARITAAARLIHAAVPRFHDYAQIDDLAREIVAEVERLWAEVTLVIGAVQRFQPAGSPPPGDGAMLVGWICRTLNQRAEQAETRLAKVLEILHCGRSEGARIIAALASAQPEGEK